MTEPRWDRLVAIFIVMDARARMLRDVGVKGKVTATQVWLTFDITTNSKNMAADETFWFN